MKEEIIKKITEIKKYINKSAHKSVIKRNIKALQDLIYNQIISIDYTILDEKEKEKYKKLTKEIYKLIYHELIINFNNAVEDLKIFLDEFELNFDKHKKTKEINFNIELTLPLEIEIEILDDLKELEQCYKSGCYKASVVLCGRILETSLHSLYYKTTGKDILEKSPGIGLGKLISKLKDANAKLDPAISQQIHLINQVRIFAVHKKLEPYRPTKNQTKAIILYTLEVLKNLF